MQVHMQMIIQGGIIVINLNQLILFLRKAVDGMQDRKEMDPKLVRGLITRSLHRSNVRKKIAKYLFDISPNSTYTSDIAYHTHAAPISVIGAIHGLDSRYRKNESLISLNIVEQINSNDMRLYRITDFGKEILESMKEKR